MLKSWQKIPDCPGFPGFSKSSSRVIPGDKMSPGVARAFQQNPPGISHFLVSFCPALIYYEGVLLMIDRFDMYDRIWSAIGGCI
ncbi:MAG: hypothetical protein EZS28_026992 [Streblomastix strix]|uniref:Uncharacterized protein n=1 Tax=Streblomastix strix TaxID=222440 RepID=A0A5J4V5T4_9EUKA|nr:MAG: hypothetical protein EZS28_026992 [Streblomastix strix]